jgi:hypothetical protein
MKTTAKPSPFLIDNRYHMSIISGPLCWFACSKPISCTLQIHTASVKMKKEISRKKNKRRKQEISSRSTFLQRLNPSADFIIEAQILCLLIGSYYLFFSRRIVKFRCNVHDTLVSWNRINYLDNTDP